MAWTTAVLATDADLTNFERNQPEVAKRFKDPTGTKTAYDGKRSLAKREIGSRLVRMGLVLDDLTPDNITSLNATATYLELSLIFNDLADSNNTMSMDKAKFYRKAYEDSWVDVALALKVPAQQTGIGFIPCGRA